MVTIMVLTVILAIPAAVALAIRRERAALRPAPLPVARLTDPPDDRAKAMPALSERKTTP